MGTDSLKSIDLNKYYRLLRTLSPKLQGLALCDCQNYTRNCSEGWENATPTYFPRFQQVETGGERSTSERFPGSTGKKRLYLPLRSYAGNKIGSLVGLYRSASRQQRGQDLQSLGVAFSALGVCILEEIHMNDELNAMADELIGRHDELNLIYDTDDQASRYQQGRESLARLVQNCIEYLAVDMAALVMPEKNQHFFEHNNPVLYSHTVVSQPWSKLYPHVKESKSSLVFNSVEDWSPYGIPPISAHRLIASPVFEGSNEVCGLLLLLRDNKAPEFTNNDRNLLDVMARKASKITQANYDSLTGLLRRNGFEYELQQALSIAQQANQQHCMLYLDLDRIHIINDIAGHKVGDELIKQVSTLIRKQVRDSDIVAHIGGDEFALLLKNCPIPRGNSIAETLRQKINAMEFIDSGNKYEVSAGIGVTSVTASIENIKDVIGAAEIASKVAKEHGGNRVWTYEYGDSDLVRRKKEMSLFNSIRDALRHDRFQLYCQTISSLSAPDQETHAEILLRMADEKGSILSPGFFMPTAEHYHMMPILDRWVIENCLQILSEYRMSLGDGIWSINLSGQSLGKPDFLTFVKHQLDSAKVPAKNICFEITETTAIDNLETAKSFIMHLKSYGCHFALDDFGTGLSSFTYLKDLPIDYLKIDGSFVKNILEDPVSAAMVTAVNHIGHIMGLKTIAEFVENELIEDALRSFGIDYGQGYAIAKPRPLLEYLEEQIDDRRISVG